MMSHRVVKQGSSSPLGATVEPGGVNFSLFSKNATLIELLLFDHEDAAAPARIIPLNANRHRTYHYWHVFVPGIEPGQQQCLLPGQRNQLVRLAASGTPC